MDEKGTFLYLALKEI